MTAPTPNCPHCGVATATNVADHEEHGSDDYLDIHYTRITCDACGEYYELRFTAAELGKLDGDSPTTETRSISSEDDLRCRDCVPSACEFLRVIDWENTTEHHDVVTDPFTWDVTCGLCNTTYRVQYEYSDTVYWVDGEMQRGVHTTGQ